MPRARVQLGTRRAARRTVAERRRACRSLVAAGGPLPTYDLNYGSPCELRFYEDVRAAGFAELARDSWPCESGFLLDSGVVFREGGQAVYKLADGTLVYARLGNGWAHVTSAAGSFDSAELALRAFRGLYPATYLAATDGDPVVPITFWAMSQFGPTARLRMIEASPWADIERNYTAAVREQLAGLMDGFEPGKSGQLLLWQGPPGTGKTWALRALASEWAPWAEFHYITDPDSFFVDSPSYMVDVLLADSYEAITEVGEVFTEQDAGGKWRVLILEDTGELLSVNAKEKYGQGLSRLLNVVDGMIGQGLRVLVLVTTNDELGELTPAVKRPGRCASQIEFAPLTPEEIREWAGEEVEEGATLAELYARAKSAEAAPALSAAVIPIPGAPGYGVDEDIFGDVVAQVRAWRDEDVLAEIARVAEDHAPEGGYGDTYWRSSDRTVFWNHADWTGTDEHDAAEAAFLAIEGVERVECESEAGPPDGFEQVWPTAQTASASTAEAELLRLAAEPLVVEAPAEREEAASAPASTPAGREAADEVDGVTAAALAAIGAAHERTVGEIGSLVSRQREADHSHSLAASAVEALGEMARREIPAPRVEVNVAAAPAPSVEMHHHAAPIELPAQPAPVVHIDLPDPAPTHVHVQLPEQPAQPAPHVDVHVQAPAPAEPPKVEVLVAATEPREPREPRVVRVDVDEHGVKRYVQE